MSSEPATVILSQNLRGRWFVQIALLSVGYFLVSRIGFTLAHSSGPSAWPADGLALGVMLVAGYRLWPAVLLGASLACYFAGNGWPAAVQAGVSETAEVLAGTWLVHRFANGRNFLDRPRNLIKFALLAGVLCNLMDLPSLLAVVGNFSNLSLNDARVWIWGMGELMSILVLTPLVVFWDRESLPRMRARHQWEYIASLILGAVVSGLVFHQVPELSPASNLLLYTTLPFAFCAALRFGPRETAMVSGVQALAGVCGLWGSFGPGGLTARVVSDTAVLTYQTFTSFSAATCLIVAAVMALRQAAQQEVERARSELEKRVLERTRALQEEIEERKRAQASLTTSEIRFRLLFETAQTGLLVVDATTGRITDLNPFLTRMLGCRREDICGELVRGAPAFREFAGECLSHQSSHPARDIRLHAIDGRAIDVEFACHSYEVNGAHVFQCSFHDITARKQSDDALRRVRDELEKRVSERTGQLVEANSLLETEVNQRREIEKALLCALSQLVDTQETERCRVARELHDELGQSLNALKLGLRLVEQQPDFVASRQRLEDLADQIIRDVHRLAWELRPPALDDFGLELALGRYAEEWSGYSGVKVDYHSSAHPTSRLPERLETALYRLTQEALTNILKHAKASVVSVVLEHREEALSLIIEDNGVGFDPPETSFAPTVNGRLGLLGMHERVLLFGGSMNIESGAGLGTTIFVRIPLQVPIRKDLITAGFGEGL